MTNSQITELLEYLNSNRVNTKYAGTEQRIKEAKDAEKKGLIGYNPEIGRWIRGKTKRMF